MAAAPVQMPATKVPLITFNGKAELVREHFCDGLGIASRSVPQVPFPLRNGKHLNMMKRL